MTQSPPFPRVPFYFMRHGQSTANKALLWAGWSDSPLTDLGIQQAQDAGKVIQNLSLSHVYHSPLQRAFVTATTATHGMEVPYTPNPDLKEANFGKFEGLPYDVGSIEDWLDGTYTDDNIGISPCGHRGESFDTFKNRIAHALNTILPHHTTGDAPLIVCHGGIFSAICSLLGHEQISVHLPNCAVVHFNPVPHGTGNHGDWHLDMVFSTDTPL